MEKLINEDKCSYEEIGRLYGCSGSNIKKVALRLGIELPSRRRINPNETFGKGIIKAPIGICRNCGKEFPQYSTSNGIYCCNKCQQEYEHKQQYKLIIEGDPSIMRANYSPRHFKVDIIKEQNDKCAICGMPQY